MDKIIVVGRIGSPHGVRGWMKLFSYTEPADNILRYKHWFLQSGDSWQALDMANVVVEAGQAEYLRIKFAGCDNPEQARSYTNLLLAVTRAQLPALALGDYYWSDLEGLNVTTTQGISLGQVSHLFSTGANDVLVVKGDRERLLPYITDVVLAVDLAAGRITVNWDADF